QCLTAPPVFGQVDGLDRRAEDSDPACGQGISEVEPGLAAELHHYAEHRVAPKHVSDAFEVERLEVEARGGIEVGADRLRVAIDEHAVVAGISNRGRRMDAAVVELDTLT